MAQNQEKSLCVKHLFQICQLYPQASLGHDFLSPAFDIILLKGLLCAYFFKFFTLLQYFFGTLLSFVQLHSSDFSLLKEVISLLSDQFQFFYFALNLPHTSEVFGRWLLLKPIQGGKTATNLFPGHRWLNFAVFFISILVDLLFYKQF